MKYPDWCGHPLLGRLAYDALPDWEKALVQPDMSADAMAKPYYPDHVKTVADKVGYLCAIMDLVYYDDCRPYATLPDGRWIPHCPPDEKWQAAMGSGQPRSPEAWVRLIELLLTRTVDAARAAEWEEFARYGGALAHHIQEPFCPGHAIDNNLFHMFFPDPDEGRHVRLHHAFDNACGDFEPLPPTLFGTTIRQAAFRLVAELERGIKQGLTTVPAVIQSFYAGEPGEARQTILREQSQRASWITTSAWHTALCIALDRFDPAERSSLAALSLTGLEPYFFHHWQYVCVLPGCLVDQGRKIPIHVHDEGGEERLIEDGFGMGGYMGIKWFVEGELYPRFRCRVGLPSRQTQGQSEHTRTRFYVEMDTEINRTYSEEIEYGAQTLAAVDLVPGAPLQTIDVDLRGAKCLILRAKSEFYTDEKGVQRIDIPHIAVCEPRLER